MKKEKTLIILSSMVLANDTFASEISGSISAVSAEQSNQQNFSSNSNQSSGGTSGSKGFSQNTNSNNPQTQSVVPTQTQTSNTQNFNNTQTQTADADDEPISFELENNEIPQDETISGTSSISIPAQSNNQTAALGDTNNSTAIWMFGGALLLLFIGLYILSRKVSK